MTALPWFVIALLVVINALYVAAEFAAVAVQKGQIAALARSGSRRAVGLSSVLEDGAQLDRYIAACQIGITLSSLIAGAYGQATIGLELGPVLEGALGLSAAAAQSSAFLLVLLILTTLQVVLGELVPKSLALQFPERAALATYLPVRWSMSLYRAFIWFLNGSGFLLLRPFGVTPGGHTHVHSPQEIQLLLAESHRGGTLTTEAHRRLERGLHLSGRTVRQLMTPRSKLHAIDASTPPSEVLRQMLASPYSRLPVYRGSLDQLIGAVNVKDVVAAFVTRGEVPPIEQLVRPIPFAPESLRSHRFVRFIQEQRSSKAIVVDEHGGVQGLISIEDVLADLFGEIGDELKDSDEKAEELLDGTVRLPGSMKLDEAESWLGTRWEGSAATVGGHLVATLARLPCEGEQLEIDGVSVKVVEMSPTAVRWVVVRPRAHEQPSRGASAEPEEVG